MALTESERLQVHRGMQRWFSRVNDPDVQAMGDLENIIKDQLKAAIDATDDWIEANQAAFNLALPVAARSNLTSAQKTLLFCVVAARRVNVNLALALLGDVN